MNKPPETVLAVEHQDTEQIFRTVATRNAQVDGDGEFTAIFEVLRRQKEKKQLLNAYAR